MPEKIILYRAFLAAPSDVLEELTIARELVSDWNLQHGQAYRARLELVNWRTHTRPAAGKRPQALINEQALDSCDLLIAVFNSRFGTPTGKAKSGTEEEVRRFMGKRKPVLVYFSAQPVPGKRPAEHSRIEKFKRQFGQRALFGSYIGQEGFEKALRNHLASTMHGLLQPKPTRTP